MCETSATWVRLGGPELGLQQRCKSGPSLGVCHGLVAAKSVAKAKPAATNFKHMGHGSAGIGAGGVFCLRGRHRTGCQRLRAGPWALRPCSAVNVLVGPIDLRHSPPSPKGRVGQMGLHIVHGLGGNGQVIACNARGNRCKKGICCGIVACKPHAARLRLAPSPDGFQPRQDPSRRG